MQIAILTSEEIDERFRLIIRQEIKSITDSQVNDNDSNIIGRDDVSNLFGVSLVTVHDWVSKGILTAYKINRKTYFKKSEVLKAMKQVKIRRKNQAA